MARFSDLSAFWLFFWAFALAGDAPLTSPEHVQDSTCIQDMKRLGHYDFITLLNPSERESYSWVDREVAAEALRRAAAGNVSGFNKSVVPSLCNQVLRHYTSINQQGVSHEMRVRMLVDFVYRVIPWREEGVDDNGISVYETVHSTLPESRVTRDLAEAFLYYESNSGSVVCGGFAWMLSWTLQYFGYWAVVLDSKFKHSTFPDFIEEGEVVRGHHTVMARICDDNSRKCKWVHLDPSIGSVIVVKNSQEMASFFDVIESFYHLQSDEGFEVVPAWTDSSTAPLPRSLIPFSNSISMSECARYWTLLDSCGTKFEPVSIPGRSDASVAFAPRTMKKMVSDTLLPADRTSWWFYTKPVEIKFDSEIPMEMESQNSFEICLHMSVAYARPPCLNHSGCVSLSDENLATRLANLTKTKIQCATDGMPYYEQTLRVPNSTPKTKYLVTDASMRYATYAVCFVLFAAHYHT
jgi:hypothetical protein